MKQHRYILLFLLPALAVMASCNGQGSSGFSGTITGAANQQASLEQHYFDRTSKTVATATCDGSGNFELELKEPLEQGLFALAVGAKKMYFIIDGTEKSVKVEGDLATMDRMEVTFTGSKTATCYANFVQKLYKEQFDIPAQATAFIQQNSCNPLMSAFFLSQLMGRNAFLYIDEFKKATKALNDYMPGSKYALDYETMITNVEKQSQSMMASEKIQTGAMAPEISLPDPNGKMRSLSDLRGKVVLLDFWASWCGPCRRANPHVVEIYKKYKSRGFDVFSVSLDKSDGKAKWVQAIQQDGLEWSSHVSDLKYWQSAPAATYGVRSIPSTFLIDREGKIVAINPRDNLEAELLKVL